MKVVAVGDNCVDVYYTMNRFYPTGNAVDFAINLKKLGQDVSLVSIQGNDVFGVAVANVLDRYGVGRTHFYPGQRQTATAQMNLINGDRVHEKFNGNVLEDFTLDRERMDYVKGFDLIYSEKWSGSDGTSRSSDGPQYPDPRLLQAAGRPYQRGHPPLSGLRLLLLREAGRPDPGLPEEDPGQDGPDGDRHAGGGRGASPYDGTDWHREVADRVEVVNTVGAGDSYVRALPRACARERAWTNVCTWARRRRPRSSRCSIPIDLPGE